MPRMHTPTAVTRTLTLAAATAAVALPALVAHAQDAVQWRVEDGGNGHWYEATSVPKGIAWLDADQAARSVGGHLATLTESTEDLFVAFTIADPEVMWAPPAGGEAGGIKGPWVGGQRREVDCDLTAMVWVTGETWDYTRWRAGTPSADCTSGLQLWDRTGQRDWVDNRDGDRTRSVAYITEWSADCNNDGIVDYGQILDGTFTDYDGDGVPDLCDAVQWRVEDGGNGHWYGVLVSDNDLTWTEAKGVSSSSGAVLASLGTQEEGHWVYENLVDNIDYWAISGDYVVGPWIGARGSGGIWTWDDGTPWDYSPWLSGEGPPSSDPTEQFAHFYAGIAGDLTPANAWGDYFDEPVTPSFLLEWSADCNDDGIVDYGQILDGTFVDTDNNGVPDCCDNRTCLPVRDVILWGDNRGGVCNVPDNLIPDSQEVTEISIGSGHAVALLDDGSIRCWGSNELGQCDIPPDILAMDTRVTSIAAGRFFTVVSTDDGSMRCWGGNSFLDCPSLADVGDLNNPVIQLSTGTSHVVALFDDGTVRCWGYNANGQCDVPDGVGDPTNHVVQISAGGEHSIALQQDGTIVCWGFDAYDQCQVPSEIGNRAVQVSGGGLHTLAVLNDGSIHGWGNDEFGQRIVPDDVGVSSNPAVQVAAGSRHSCALLQDGSVVCWGAGESDSGIDPDQGQSIVPSAIALPYRTRFIASGSDCFNTAAFIEQADCNEDGVLDYGQILDGSLADCDGNGVPDECDLNATLAMTAPGTPSGTTDYITFDVSSLPDARDTVSIEISALGELAGPSRFLIVYLDEPTLENRIGIVFANAGENCLGLVETLEMPVGGWNDAGIDGSRSVIIAGSGLDQVCGEDSYTAIDVTVPIVIEDCNENGLWDACEIAEGTLIDTDADGISDDCDGCPNDPNKTEPGICGCGTPDSGDADDDGILDCVDPCPNWPYECSEDGQTLFVAVGEPIQSAVDVVPAGGTVSIGPGTHVGTGDSVITLPGDGISLIGSGGSTKTIIDGQDARRGLTGNGCGADGTLIQGLTFINGVANTGGGIHLDGCSPTVVECVLRQNTTNQGGGGMYCNNSDPMLENCRFENNKSTDYYGGGMINYTSSPTLTNCTFIGNTAYNGDAGGMYNFQQSNAVLTGCLFIDNHAGGGGGMRNKDSNPTMINCRFESNSASVDGGGLYNNAGSDPMLDGCEFVANTAAGLGGGAYIDGCSPQMIDCVFTLNTSLGGGGIFFQGQLANPVLDNCEFVANEALNDGAGGGIFSQSGTTLSLTDCSFTSNIAGFGAGLNGDAESSSTLDGCSFTDNVSSMSGGGVQLSTDSTATVSDCIFTTNMSAESGGGVDCFGNSHVTINDCTFTGNIAGLQGNAVAKTMGGTIRIENSSICDNNSGFQVVDIDGGHDHSIALLSTGEVKCWGSKTHGQSTVPMEAMDPTNPVVDVEAGSWHSLAIRADGTVVCWGTDNFDVSTPPAILTDGSARAVQIEGGEYHSLALLDSGEVIGWGRNNDSEITIPATVNDPDREVRLVRAAAHTSIAVMMDGSIEVWGRTSYSQGSGQDEVPADIGPDGIRAVDVSGGFHILALLEDGSIRCWGAQGQSDIPEDIGDPGARVQAVRATGFQTFVVLEDGSIRCWGSGTTGGSICPLPDEVVELGFPGDPPLLVARGAYHALVVDARGSVVAWGSNQDGQTNVPFVTVGQIFGDYEDLGGNCITDICDTDGDGTIDCDDGCPDDPEKIDPGQCGCGIEDLDTDDDGIADCLDPCPNWPYDCSDDGQTIFVAVGQSIQNALYAIPEGGVIEVASGTFPIDDLNGLLKTDGEFTLRGSVDVEGIPTTILDAGGDGRLMTLSFGQTNDTIIENLVLQNGGRSNTAGAVGLNNNSSPTFRNCWFRNNTAGRDGGAVHVIESTPRFESCRFQINLANEEGGAVYAITSSIVFTDCFFDGNTSAEGGAMVFEGSTGNLIDASTFIDNIADRGGAIQLGDSDLLVTTSSFDGNISPVSGSAINADVSTLEIAGSVICSNGPAEQVSGGYADLGDNCIVEDCGDDLDGNGIPDACDPDCNGDGIPDAYEISVGTQLDCDLDGIPDGCAVEDGIALDCNLNGIPDACDILDGVERDDNLNDIPDSCELARGDLNLDGCIDSGDLGLLIALWGITDPPIGDLNGDNIIAAADLGLLIGNWSPCDP